LDHFNIPNLHQSLRNYSSHIEPISLGPVIHIANHSQRFNLGQINPAFLAEPQIMPQLFSRRQTFFTNLLGLTDNSAMSIPTHTSQTLAFIGGGNMASAIIGGLVKQGTPANQILVVEPFEETRQRLISQWGVRALAQADAALKEAGLVIWAVKPQTFKEAAHATAAFCQEALHLSVAAGIRSSSIAHWLGTERIVRAMPNTPALVGLGQTGLFARSAVTPADKQWVERVVATTGALLWVDDEALLDAVTAISGSGPAYVFFFIEAMVEAGVKMGLSADQATQLAIGTFTGASQLALSASEPPSVLRERVTSKGGTTYAALTAMQNARVSELFQAALQAARQRAHELGDEFGA
jgi:pyrroline-5-carboxylate reductase